MAFTGVGSLEQFTNFVTGQALTLTQAVNSIFGASGPNHSVGLVPDPGAVGGTTRFLREDGTWAVGQSGRTTLTQDTTYFVLTNGSDNNNGLSNTPSGAFQTIQKALNTVAALDCSTFNVTIQVGDGTYTGGATLTNTLGTGNFTLQGDTTTPANCVISTTGANAITAAGINTTWTVSGFTLQTATSGFGVIASQNAKINLNKVNFGTVPVNFYHIIATQGGRISIQGDYTISGGASVHWFADTGSSITVQTPRTITLTGTPNFSSWFSTAQTAGQLKVDSITFSGSATGTRFNAIGNGVIYTNGAASTYLPGSVAGTTGTGGQYA